MDSVDTLLVSDCFHVFHRNSPVQRKKGEPLRC